MDLRSRSRSKTPFPPSETLIESQVTEGNHVTLRSARKSITTKTISSHGGIYTEEYSSTATEPTVESTTTNKSRSSRKYNKSAAFKTSDYSSEEGEIEAGHITQNQKNQIIEDAKRAANGNMVVSALDLYRKAGTYWDKYPKTDWTYSPHSRDRVEIAPGVVQMPNMSRPTIHKYDSSTNTDDHYFYERLTSRTHDHTGDEISFKLHRVSSGSSRRTFISTVTSYFLSIFTFAFWCIYTLYETQNSVLISLGKWLHHFASRLMLLDTWLLKKSAKRSKIGMVVTLCLLPLLLFIGWWLLSSLGNAIYSTYFNPPAQSTVILPATAVPAPQYIEQNHIQPPPEHFQILKQEIERLSNDLYQQRQNELPTDEIIQKVIESPKIQNLMNTYETYITNIEQDNNNDKLMLIINDLRQDIERVRSENARTVAKFSQQLKRCCRQSFINLDPYISKIVGDLLNNPEFLSKQEGLSKYLNGLFLAKQELEQRLANITQNLPVSYEKHIEATALRIMNEIVANMALPMDSDSLTNERIKKIVNSALAVYDADKTGLVDYAMEPMGGQVLTTRCTETYHSGTAVISILGVPVWYPTVSPRTVITPGVNPGECWPFQNFPGFLVLKLSTAIKVEAFSYEHISKLLVPNGRIDSAPKDFEIYGLKQENDKEPVLIGDYVYDYDGESIQYFTAHNHGLVFEYIEIRIKSNHGNPNYTCLYRFRVHGSVSSDEST